MHALASKNPEIQLPHGEGEAYSEFRLSLALTAVRANQQDSFNHDEGEPSLEKAR